MSNQPEYPGATERYPHQPHEGRPEPSGRRHAVTVALATVGVLSGLGLVVALGYGALWAVNPMGDEWVCSDGEAPAGKPPSYNQCFDEDATLPRGYEWDPFGNRPIPSNCDKDGWVQIERPVRGKGTGNMEEDCVREGTNLPGRWRVIDDE